jgi:hypothetical protein
LDIPQEFIEEYKLTGLDRDGWIYFEIRQGCYGLPQAGILANDLCRSRLKAKGFYEAASTPSLWHHKWRPIQFCLIVDNFDVEYVGLAHVTYLLDILKKFHGIQYNMAGDKFAGMASNGNTLLPTATSVCQAIYLCRSSNTSIHNPPNHDYLHIKVSLLPTVPSCTSH